MFGRVGIIFADIFIIKRVPVYELKTGTKIGEVCDLNISSNGIVKGLLVKKGVLIKKTFIY